jgi:hypothetical protein
MEMDVQAGHDVWRTARRPARVFGLAVVLVVALTVLIPSSGAAQDEPQPASTPHYVRSTPIPPGAMVPTPGTAPAHEHMVGIIIAGFPFMMHPGPCVRSVSNAIMAHDDLFTGDPVCDAFIRQARAIQRQKEAEDPTYANEPRITPAPAPTESGAGQSQQ